MRNVSIKWRMTLWFTLVMVVICTLMLVFVMLMNRNTVTQPPQAEVVDVVQSNADDVEFEHGYWDFSDLEMFAHGVYTQVFDESGKAIAGATPVAVNIDAPAEKTGHEVRTVSGSDGEDYYVYDMLYSSEEGKLWIRGTIAEDTESSVMDVIVPLAWSLLPAIVVLSALGGWLISTLSFKPLEEVIASAEAISGGEDLSKRIALPRGRSEINRLAGAFDDMFDRLERSFEAEAQFAGDASHELRTPVTVILAECETLESGEPAPKEYKEGIAIINSQAQQMSKLIGQLLHITRLEQGTQSASFERINLGELVGVVCQQQKSVAPEGTELSWRAEDIMLEADVILMTRLLNNLIGNAFSYGRANGRVEVALHRENNSAVLTVSDDGIGIPPEQQQRIWKRFYRVDAARSGDKGTGLGLYMVRQIARIHGGEAYVESALGQGSTFTVRLPLENK